MPKRENKYAVKGIMYPKGRERYVDGPWKPTPEEAITAFAVMLSKKEELARHLVSRPFVAEKCDEKVAPSKDGKGNCYRRYEDHTDPLGIESGVRTRLAQLGVSL